MDQLIKAQSLSKKIKGEILFSDLNFEISPGEILLIHGPNGSGKSILLKMIAGLFKPNEGELHRNTKNIAYSPFENGLDQFLSVSSNLKLWSPDAKKHQSQINTWGLTDFAHKKVEKLSNGQKKRISLANCFAQEAQLYLLDEPTVGLDTNYVDTLIKEIQSKTSTNSSFVIATHNCDIFTNERLKTINLERK